MKTALFSEEQFKRMAESVQKLLGTAGFLVDHPEVKEKALKTGCKESSTGRILFNSGQIEGLRSRLKKQYPEATEEPYILHKSREFRSGFGNLTPKIFDYETGKPEMGTTASLENLIKFAQGDKRVASITIPLSRSNIPAPIEQLDAIMLMARLSDKKIGATDATVPESVPFLAEMGVVLGHKPGVFVGCCNCINPPLRLERRTAETMIQRSKYHSRSMITSMPALGGSAPVDIQGTVILATAEIVGGLILSFIIDPEAPLLGYIASVQVDMRSGNPASSSPQTIKVDAGVFQLMEYAFGGGTGVGGRSYISAKRPGLQAVFERFLKAVGYSELADGHMFGFSGNGNLDNGSMVSPEQYLLDMEITGGLENMWTIPAVSDEDITGRISKNILEEGGNFLAAEHTIANYRKEAWFPRLFSYSSKTPSEQEMLDACHATYRETVAGYRPASYPAEILKELDAVYKKAKKALIK